MLSKSRVINSRPWSYELIFFLLLPFLIVFNKLLSVLHPSIDFLLLYLRIVICWPWISNLISGHIKHFLSLLELILLPWTMLWNHIIVRPWSHIFCRKRLSDWFVELCANLVLWLKFLNFISSWAWIFNFFRLKIAFIQEWIWPDRHWVLWRLDFRFEAVKSCTVSAWIGFYVFLARHCVFWGVCSYQTFNLFLSQFF